MDRYEATGEEIAAAAVAAARHVWQQEMATILANSCRTKLITKDQFLHLVARIDPELACDYSALDEE